MKYQLTSIRNLTYTEILVWPRPFSLKEKIILISSFIELLNNH